jgi:catechol 2,3-dioxygenase-like lactoylglutathione lyase family enzyme
VVLIVADLDRTLRFYTDAAYAELVAKGARPVTPPARRPWGQRTAYVADPDGHLIELAQGPTIAL